MCCKRVNPMREKLSILLLAALLLGTLAACQSGPASQSDPKRNETSSSPPSAYLGPDFSGSGSADSSEQPAAEPEREPVLEFDPGYALDIDYPTVANGVRLRPAASLGEHPGTEAGDRTGAGSSYRARKPNWNGL